MEGVDDEENANLLQFGPDHKEEMSCLSNAEVAIILEKQRVTYEEKDINVTPAFSKTMSYVKRFGGQGGNAQVTSTSEMRETLQQFEAFHEGESVRLHQFEIMQVANLMQSDSEVEEVRPLL
ncbi:unnamed protein product, partial [Hapterophycus canaliculatus]